MPYAFRLALRQIRRTLRTRKPVRLEYISRIFHKLTCTLACLLIPQENLLQSAVITDTPLLLKIPCKTNILRDHHTNS
jgi:hypothetical protein